MAWVLLAAAFAVACVVAAWMMPRRIAQTGESASALVASELEQVLATGDAGRRARVVTVNEVLADLEFALSPDTKRPTRLAWIAFFSGWAFSIPASIANGMMGLLPCAGFAVCGALLCLQAKRAAVVAAESARVEVDGRVQQLVPELYNAEFVLPKRREMRWKRPTRVR